MKKKILSIAACAAMVLSLTACGKDENPPANLQQSSAGNTVSTPNNSKPDTASTPAVSNAPAVSSTPAAPSVPDSTHDTTSTPEAPEEIDWSTVPYADEFDFVGEDFNGGVRITQYLGKEKVINIPTTVDGEKVTFVSLTGNGDITDINIPDSVTVIGYGAFYGWTSLTSVNIPDGVTGILGYTFSGCSSLTNITIPDSVTAIGNDAFNGCISLTSITIPDSVTMIGMRAFEDCTNLTSINIPDSVIEIASNAFRNCTKVKVKYKGKEYDYKHLDSLYSDINGN